MISEEYKFLFIDITKTAGTAVGSVLQQLGGVGKHHSVGRPLPALPQNKGLESPVSRKLLEAYFCFTFVRHPYDRLLSLYAYCQSAPLQRQFAARGWAAVSGAAHRPLPEYARDRQTYWPTDFPTFVEWLVEHESYYNDFTGEKYIPMYAWLVGKDGRLSDRLYLGYYEQLEKDFAIIMQRIDQRLVQLPTLPVANKSSGDCKQQARAMLQSSPLLQNMIQEHYVKDFACFAYEV